MITLSEKQVWFLVGIFFVLLIVVAMAAAIGGSA